MRRFLNKNYHHNKLCFSQEYDEDFLENDPQRIAHKNFFTKFESLFKSSIRNCKILESTKLLRCMLSSIYDESFLPQFIHSQESVNGRSKKSTKTLQGTLQKYCWILSIPCYQKSRRLIAEYRQCVAIVGVETVKNYKI